MFTVQQKAQLISHMGSDLTVVNAARTKTHQAIIEAYQRGYYVTDDGILQGKKGPRTISCYGNQRYPTFCISIHGKPYAIPVHQFAAFCFDGVTSFRKNIVVRHLDGNVLNVSKQNIQLGTHSENNLDKASSIRQKAAKKARQTQGIQPLNSKLNKQQVQEIRDFYKTLNGKKAPNGSIQKLCEKFKVTRQTLWHIKKGSYYKIMEK